MVEAICSLTKEALLLYLTSRSLCIKPPQPLEDNLADFLHRWFLGLYFRNITNLTRSASGSMNQHTLMSTLFHTSFALIHLNSKFGQSIPRIDLVRQYLHVASVVTRHRRPPVDRKALPSALTSALGFFCPLRHTRNGPSCFFAWFYRQTDRRFRFH